MIDLYDFLLGGLTPLAFAAAGFALGWTVSRRPTAAWSAGVVLGYAAGTAAIDARGAGLREALSALVRPQEAYQWIPLMGLIAVAPSLAAAMGNRRALRWLLAAPLCALVPLWLLWGGKYLPSLADRETGFATSAWIAGDAVLILGGVACGALATWWLLERMESIHATRSRSLLAIIALTGAAAAVGLTGSFSIAQGFGVLATSLGGCFLAVWLLGIKAGPEAAAGPTLMIAGSLLLLAACYSKLQPLQAVGLWMSMTLSAAWIPGLSRIGGRWHVALRTALCLIPLTVIVGLAGAKFAETQRQQREATAANPYLDP